MAHKKGQGSTRNGRDSISKRLGIKATSGEYVTLRAFMDAPPGESIVYRGAKLTMNGGME